jgi:hypothetical protein
MLPLRVLSGSCCCPPPVNQEAVRALGVVLVCQEQQQLLQLVVHERV